MVYIEDFGVAGSRDTSGMVDTNSEGETIHSTDEQERLRILRSYQILDTPEEPEFDSLTRLATRLCEVPIATVTLVDANRQWFKAKTGLTVAETSRDVAFCDYAIRDTQPLVIPDTLLDPRFRDNPLVTGDPHLRFYAGIPLVTPEGAIIGTFCAMDRKPRELSPRQMEDLTGLAHQAMAQLELRRQRTQLAGLLIQQERSAQLLQVQTEHLVEAQRIAQVGSWEYEIEPNRLTWSKIGRASCRERV